MGRRGHGIHLHLSAAFKHKPEKSYIRAPPLICDPNPKPAHQQAIHNKALSGTKSAVNNREALHSSQENKRIYIHTLLDIHTYIHTFQCIQKYLYHGVELPLDRSFERLQRGGTVLGDIARNAPLVPRVGCSQRTSVARRRTRKRGEQKSRGHRWTRKQSYCCCCCTNKQQHPRRVVAK